MNENKNKMTSESKPSSTQSTPTTEDSSQETVSSPTPQPEITISTTNYKKELDKALRSSIKSVVSSTNNTLASLEHTTDATSTNILSRITPIAGQLRYAARRASEGYSNRQTYGPPIIMGSALLIGSLVSLRRGKMIGGFSGILTAGGCYTNIYGIDASEVKRKFI